MTGPTTSSQPTPAKGARAAPREFFSNSWRVLLGATCVASIVAGLLAGAAAFAAVLAGGGVALALHASLARGLRAALGVAQPSARRGATLAGVGFCVRQGLAALLLFTCVRVLQLPAAWLLVGVSTWPLALTVVGLCPASRRTAPSARLLAGA